MKTLPDNPDIAHLRQQAKDLLAGLRDIDATTSLATAQKTLATQYGFPHWTELKAEVDRLRGTADVAEPALARAVADAFGLGAVTGEMRSMARADDMGRPWSLRTDRGRWAVRTMDTWWPIVSHEDDVALQEAAAKAGVLLPAPVRSRSGNVAETVEGHVWRAYEWQHSGPPMAAPASSKVTYEMGGILATLHGLALPVDRISPWHARRLIPVTWPELAATARKKGAVWATELDAAVPILEELATIEDQPGDPVLSHNTIGPGQVRRGPNGRLTVFAWEHAGGQPPTWELGNALMDWANNMASLRSALRGPQSGVFPPARGGPWLVPREGPPCSSVQTPAARSGVADLVAGARAMVEGYHETAGTLPKLGMGMFRGAVTGLANYVFGLADHAMEATDEEDRRYADRSVRHVLANLPTLATFEQLLAAVG